MNDKKITSDRIKAAEIELANAILEEVGKITILKLSVIADKTRMDPLVKFKSTDVCGMVDNGVSYKTDDLNGYAMPVGGQITGDAKTPFGVFNLTLIRVG